MFLVHLYCEIISKLLVVTSVSTDMTLSTNTVIAIKQVLREEMKPKWIEDDTLNTMKKGVRHLKSVIQKDRYVDDETVVTRVIG